MVCDKSNDETNNDDLLMTDGETWPSGDDVLVMKWNETN